MPANKQSAPASYHTVEGQTLPASMEKPSSRRFRNAWRYDADHNVIVVNMAKAKDLKREEIRLERAALLADLDWRQQSALVQGKADGAKTIEAQKQKLRDAPAHPKIAKARTPEALEKLSVSDLMKD